MAEPTRRTDERHGTPHPHGIALRTVARTLRSHGWSIAWAHETEPGGLTLVATRQWQAEASPCQYRAIITATRWTLGLDWGLPHTSPADLAADETVAAEIAAALTL
jgi:hypothetical protein